MVADGVADQLHEGVDMRMTVRASACFSVSLAILAAASAAQAQSTIAAPPAANTPLQTPAPEASAAGSTALQEVVVTAQRRSQNLQNVPISVTSFSGDALAAQQIGSTLDLGREVPNMFAANNVGQGSANVYYIRGLGQTQSFPTFEAQVGTYIDDIYISRQNANNFALFGVDQIQVLNGPQGTLFGRNSTGGAIVVTLQKPGETFGGDAQAGGGSYDGYTFRGSVNLPINSQILTRTSAYAVGDSGYVHDVTTGQSLDTMHNWGVREAVSFLPAALSNVRWDIAGDYEHNNNANLLNQPADGGQERISYSGFTTQGGALEPYLGGSKSTFGQGAFVNSFGLTSNIKASFSAGTLNLITGVRGLSQHLAADFPAASLGPLQPGDTYPTGEITLAQALRNSQYSQEIKWTGDLGSRLNYTAGAFYLFETNSNDYGQVLGLAPTLALPLNDQLEKNQTISEAVYAQGDLKVTSKLTFTLGGRFTHEIKTTLLHPSGAGPGYTTADVQAEGYPTHLDANEFTPRIALQYQIDPNLMVFGSATRGFQGGGWNGLTGASPADYNNFSPETIWSYETGFRSQTPDRRLRVNATAFYENVNNYQLLSDNPATNSFDTSNAANLAAYGLETNITWKPVRRLTLGANISTIRAMYFDQSALIRDQQASCLAGVAGTCDSGIVRANGSLATPVYTPALDLSTTASYIFDFPLLTVTPNFAVQYVSREWFDTANTEGSASSYPTPAGGRDKPRTLIDFGVTFAPKAYPVTITAECKNCTMVDYGTADLLGLDYFNQPGTFDVSLAFKF